MWDADTGAYLGSSTYVDESGVAHEGVTNDDRMDQILEALAGTFGYQDGTQEYSDFVNTIGFLHLGSQEGSSYSNADLSVYREMFITDFLQPLIDGKLENYNNIVSGYDTAA